MREWQFEAQTALQSGGTSLWQGFSPAVSDSLEAAYQHWAQNDSKRPGKVRSSEFMYAVDFASIDNNPDDPKGSSRKAQRIRRVSIIEAEDKEEALMRANAEKKHESQLELALLREELERLKETRAAEADANTQQLAKLEAELAELRLRCENQMAEMLRLRDEAGAGLSRLLSGIYPGRLVALAPGSGSLDDAPMLPASASKSLLIGRVSALDGPRAAVDFPGNASLWVPCVDLQLARKVELLCRPGTRVVWEEEEEKQDGLEGGGIKRVWHHGVVCDSVDEATVNVLGANGKKRAYGLKQLWFDDRPRSSDLPLEVGDLARVDSALMHTQGVEDCVGMVVRSQAPGMRVRFKKGPPDHADHVDIDVVHEVSSTVKTVERDEVADGVRPGTAVRFRSATSVPPALGPDSIGVVYATHGDGTSVVDFVSAFGLHINASLLEPVDHPHGVDHEMLLMFSEIFGWHEVCAQLAEEREHEALFNFVSTLASCHCSTDPQEAPYVATSWGPHTCIHRLVTRILLGSLQGHRLPPHAEGAAFCDPPILGIEHVESISNPALQHAYEAAMKFIINRHPHGCTTLPAEVEALQVTGRGIRDINELFLWYGTSLDFADHTCVKGPDRRPGIFGDGLYFAESASAADLNAVLEAGDVDVRGGVRCLLLVRVLLGESVAVSSALHAETTRAPLRPSEQDGVACCDSVYGVTRSCGGVLDYPEHVVYNSAHALPVFRVYYRHDTLCRCCVCSRSTN